ncbi:WG repeat-containing protein [Oscillospiraceae bacterium WX1]
MKFQKITVALLSTVLLLTCGACGNKTALSSPATSMNTSAEIGLYPAYTSADNMDKLWGYIDQTGNFAIKPQFDSASDFTKNKVAIVSKNNEFGIIDRSGNFIVKPTYETAFDYHEGYAVAHNDKDDKSYVYDDKGDLLFSYPGYISDYSDGLASVEDKESKLYGYIDATGKMVITPQFRFTNDFKNGKAFVTSADKENYFIDKNGDIISEQVAQDPDHFFQNTRVFPDGLRITSNETSDFVLYGLNDKNGKVILNCEYVDIERINDTLFSASKAINGYTDPMMLPKAIFDKSGKQLSDFIYYDIEDAGDKLIVSDNISTYYLNYDGTATSGFPTIKGSDSIETINNLVRATSDGGQVTAYYTLDGKVFWQPSSVYDLSNGIKLINNTSFQDRYLVTDYPQLDGWKDKVQDAINKKLKDAFLSDEGSGNPVHQDLMDDQVFIKYSYTLNKNLLGINELDYTYSFGAHGYSGDSSYLIDLTSGQFYSLSDLFKKGSDYKDVLETIIANQIKDQKMDLFDNNPSVDDSVFYIDDKGNLEFLYNQYVIAAYAAGQITFEIPYSQIMNLIDTNGSFWNSFNKSLSNSSSSYSGNPGDISTDMIRNVINRYEDRITMAITVNNFSIVASYLYPDSTLYNDQQQLVAKLSTQNVYEGFVSADVLKTEKVSDTSYKAYVHEVISISIGNAKAQDTAFDWIYTMKFSDTEGRYLLSDIEKWNR